MRSAPDPRNPMPGESLWHYVTRTGEGNRFERRHGKKARMRRAILRAQRKATVRSYAEARGLTVHHF